jgi:hypothetical protein
MPAPGNTLELNAFVKGENVKDLTAGGRVYVLIQVFPQGTTSGNEPSLKEDFDWVLLKATLENFPKEAESIRVSLAVPTLTLGKVYFDEITLIAK